MSVIPDAMSEALDFNNIKRRSVAARNYRVKLNPSNGTQFTGGNGNQIEFVLPSNLAGSYMDFSQMYLKFKLAVVGAAGNLDKCGAYGIINRLECYTAGSQIYTLNNYNVLAATLLDTDATIGYKGGAGKVLAGLQGNGTLGEYLPTAGRTFCLPFILHPMAMQKKLIPLFSLDSLRFRITLENYVNAFVSGGALTGYTVSDVQLCGYVTELSGAAQSQIDAMTGGVYQVLCPSYTNVQTTVVGGVNATTATATLGVAVSSLERILVVHRVSASVNALANQSLGARITNNLASFQFSIDSSLYPQAPILVGDAGAEALAEMLISSHALSDMQNDAHIASQLYASALTVGATANMSILIGAYEGLYSYLQIPASDAAKNCWFNAVGDGSLMLSNAGLGSATPTGSFVASIELENGTSAARSDRLYSGISTIGSVVQYIGTYNANSAASATVDFFCHYTILCTLDMKRLGVWQVSV